MGSQLKRTSMALDAESIGTIELLSDEWHVSKAEVLRRSLKLAKEQHEQEKPALTPQEALLWLSENGITRKQADDYMEELKAEREAWRDPWEEYEASRHQSTR